MSVLDIILLCLVGLAVALAVFSRIRARKNGGGCSCSGSCAGCSACISKTESKRASG